jgi:hypothetical protein
MKAFLLCDACLLFTPFRPNLAFDFEVHPPLKEFKLKQIGLKAELVLYIVLILSVALTAIRLQSYWICMIHCTFIIHCAHNYQTAFLLDLYDSLYLYYLLHSHLSDSIFFELIWFIVVIWFIVLTAIRLTRHTQHRRPPPFSLSRHQKTRKTAQAAKNHSHIDQGKKSPFGTKVQ